MAILDLVRQLKEIYYVNEIYYAYKDIVELHFILANNSVTLCYSGKTIRESTYKDMIRRIEDDLDNMGV